MKGNSVNTAALELRNIRAVYNRAIKDELVSIVYYPFREYKIPTQKTRKRNLSIQQVKKIRKAKLTGLKEQARDVWMLVFYLIGINMKDLYYLKPTDVVDDRIIYDMAKTGKEYSIKIEPETMKIINKYRDPDSETLLRFYKQYKDAASFVKYTNMKLFEFMPVLKIKEKVTTYYARHSWATIAYNNGISKDTVQLALGHGEEVVTDTYINFDLKTVDDANRKVIDLVV